MYWKKLYRIFRWRCLSSFSHPSFFPPTSAKACASIRIVLSLHAELNRQLNLECLHMKQHVLWDLWIATYSLPAVKNLYSKLMHCVHVCCMTWNLIWAQEPPMGKWANPFVVLERHSCSRLSPRVPRFTFFVLLKKLKVIPYLYSAGIAVFRFWILPVSVSSSH